MTMICRNCGTRNPEDSKFCNKCGSALRPATSLICPNCGASNPNDLLYCDSCGTRLQQPDIPSEERTPDDSPEKGESPPTPFALPSRPPGKTANLSISGGIPDWLKTGDKPEDAETGDLEKHRPGDDLPTWLLDEGMEPGLFQDTRSTDELFASAEKAEPGQDDAIEQDLPEWLRGLAPEGTGPLPMSGTGATGEQDQNSLDDWLADFEQAAQGSGTPAWLEGAESDSAPDVPGDLPEEGEWPAELQDDAVEGADWLEDLEAGEPAASRQSEGSSRVETQDEEAGVVGWLARLDAASQGEADQPAERQSARHEDEKSEFQEEGVPDWLAEEPAPREPVPAQDPSEIIPDWLGDLDDVVPDEKEPSPAAQEIPDWLADLEADEAGAVPADVEEEPVTGIPGWLGDLGEVPTAPVQEIEHDEPWLEETEPEGEPATESDIPDWLSELPSPELDQVTPADELSTWLEEEEAPAPLSTGEEREGPKWPVRGEELPERSAAEEDPGAGAGEGEKYDWLPEGKETPDWLLAIEPEEEAETAPAEDEVVPDWLSELDAAIGELEAASSEGVGDWLEDVEGAEPEAGLEDVDEAWAAADSVAAQAGEPEPEEADETRETERLPAWLAPTELSVRAEHLEFEPEPPGGEEEGLPEEPLMEAEPGDDEAIPDWLQELEQFGDASALSAEDTEVPDWLREDLVIEPAVEEEPELFEEELPATRAEEGAPESEDYGEYDEAEVERLFGALEEGGVVPADELPDWLDDVVTPETFAVDTGPEIESVPEVLASQDLPDWLEDSLPDDESAEPTPAEELPSWLQHPGGPDEREPLADIEMGAAGEWADILGKLGDTGDAQEEAEALSAAEIPEWLEALKPGERYPERAEARAAAPVSEGPLAGLSGVLSVEPIIATRRSAELGARHEASKEQQQQAALLRQLVRTEPHEAERVVGPPQAASSPWLRLVLSVLLLAAVLAGLFLPDLVPVTLAPVYPVAPVSDVLAGAAGEPVLVLFDYTPALGGILNEQADLLLQGLAAQDSPVIYGSQSAAGLGLGTSAIAQVEALQVERLGYIPGETLGLRRLASCLSAGEATATACDGYPADTARVAAIILLTGERDSLVDWIEQVGPAVDIPVIAGVTRALAPVAAPYYASGQIDAMLAGEPASLAFASATIEDNTIVAEAGGSQMAQALATWLVVGLLLAGNFAFLVWGLAGSRRTRGS